MTMLRAHPRCWDGQEEVYLHICRQLSGRVCAEDGCTELAGTLWTKHWCPDHDVERIDRITAQLLKLQSDTLEERRAHLRRLEQESQGTNT